MCKAQGCVIGIQLGAQALHGSFSFNAASHNTYQ